MEKLIRNMHFDHSSIYFDYPNEVKVKICFWSKNILRIMLDPAGAFSEQPTIMHELNVPDEGDKTVATGGAGQHFKEPIILGHGSFGGELTKSGLDSGDYQVIIDENLPQIKVTDKAGKTIFLQEGQPLVTGKEKFLGIKIISEPSEHFYGGGTQNGIVDLKGKKIQIENQNMWTEGGVASPVPFFFSTKGYGVLCNTFTKGSYSFHTPRATVVQHEDSKMDLFIILGEKPETIINGYHKLTGKPQLNPLYSYYPAHLNAYNRDYWVEVTADSDGAILFPDGKYYKEYQPIREKTFNTGYRPGTITVDGQKLVPNVTKTHRVSFTDADEEGNPKRAIRESLNGEKENYQFSARWIIDRYKKNDLPLGWFLPNDGYGAGYGQTDSLDGDVENLADFGNYARENGVEIGLWTQENLHPTAPEQPQKDERDLEKEVAKAGVAALKTDVAWVGEGYTFGLNGISDAYEKMHSISSKRPFIITLDGWAGTQRYGSIWSGDQEGADWQNIKFHIPTYLSTGLSGNPNVGADIDGIFGGGNPVIQTRDLEWKSFTPIQLSMDGWGVTPKDLGLLYGSEFVDINRFYLKLKTTLLPYFYSLAFQARETGKPILRPTFFAEAKEYTYGSSLEKQFLLGDALLIAPIFEPYQLEENGDDKRASLYLPDASAEWIDFFTGDVYKGDQTLTEFSAPLWKLPLFVKAGSVIPLFNATNHPEEIDYHQRQYLIYPGSSSSFTVYEDDGISNDFEANGYSLTKVTQEKREDKLQVSIERTQGTYTGMVEERRTKVEIFSLVEPKLIEVNGQVVDSWQYGSREMPHYSPTDSTSRFSQTKLEQGKFITIIIPEQSVFESTDITVKY